MQVSASLVLCVLSALYVVPNTVSATWTTSWAVQIQSASDIDVNGLAVKHGFTNLGLIGNLDDVYHFKLKDSNAITSSNGEAGHITEKIREEENVVFVEQQERRRRYKRGYIPPQDPYWPYQWNLFNDGRRYDAYSGNDLNVERAWLQGLAGSGVIIGVVDDGVDYRNADLSGAYLSGIQFDFLDEDYDAFPAFNPEKMVLESHGTNCAGEIAMTKNNFCGVGVAFNSRITGLRLISALKGATDRDEAEALAYRDDIIDIYSNSWGPSDSGKHVAGPGVLTEMTLRNGVNKGRQGKGSIYLFAAGNGGDRYDTCAADGYVSSIYTVSVGSVAIDGKQSYYDEECSGKLVVAFTDDYFINGGDVVTTSVDNTCVDNFIGTSASTPLVSGTIALLLERNPNLGWRDVQYLLVYTSDPSRLVDGDWTLNGAGLLVSHKHGFGAVDAEALVTRGKHWVNVSPQKEYSVTPQNNRRLIPGQRIASIEFIAKNQVEFLEHVVVIFNLRFQNPSYWLTQRGKIEVTLESPAGTKSTLLALRRSDKSSLPYESWSLMSVHFWGEKSGGKWRLTIANYNTFTFRIGRAADVVISKIVFYGASSKPVSVSPTCSAECDSSRGCAALGGEFCDACAELRVASTLECVSTCPAGLQERNGYCY